MSSTPWQSTIHILVDTTPILDLLRYQNKNSDGDNVWCIFYPGIGYWDITFSNKKNGFKKERKSETQG